MYFLYLVGIETPLRISTKETVAWGFLAFPRWCGIHRGAPGWQAAGHAQCAAPASPAVVSASESLTVKRGAWDSSLRDQVIHGKCLEQCLEDSL